MRHCLSSLHWRMHDFTFISKASPSAGDEAHITCYHLVIRHVPAAFWCAAMSLDFFPATFRHMPGPHTNRRLMREAISDYIGDYTAFMPQQQLISIEGLSLRWWFHYRIEARQRRIANIMSWLLWRYRHVDDIFSAICRRAGYLPLWLLRWLPKMQ